MKKPFTDTDLYDRARREQEALAGTQTSLIGNSRTVVGVNESIFPGSGKVFAVLIVARIDEYKERAPSSLALSAPDIRIKEWSRKNSCCQSKDLVKVKDILYRSHDQAMIKLVGCAGGGVVDIFFDSGKTHRS